MKKKFRTTKYITAFAITTLIFLLGIILGNYISNEKLSAIDELQHDLTIKTIGTEIEYLLVAEHPCETFDSAQLSEELFEIGSKLDYMESQLGKKNKDVINLKEYYSLLEIRHWFLMKKVKEECKLDHDLIIYFYSNLGDCDECEQQGYVLSTLHKKYPGINIYSFDINIDDAALNALKRIFEVESVPTVIINDEVFNGSIDKAEIESKLKNT